MSVASSTRFADALIFCLALALLCLWCAFTILSNESGALQGRLGGDFPAFFGSAQLVATGRAHELYNEDAQADIQAAYFEQDGGGWLRFAYPPVVAALYTPLLPLGFKYAYLVHGILLLAALWRTSIRLSDLDESRHSWQRIFAFSIALYPVFASVQGGQNAPFFLYCAVASADFGRRRSTYVAGLFAGLLCLKPQLALALLPACFLFLQASATSSRRTAALGFGAGLGTSTAIIYLASAALTGLSWPLAWLRYARHFRETEAELNRGSLISLSDYAGTLLPASAAEWLAGALAAGALLFTYRWAKRNPTYSPWQTVPLLLLCIPHVFYYDTTLVLPALLALPVRWPRLVWIAPISWLAAASSWFAMVGVVGLAVACLTLPMEKRSP